MQQYFFVTLLSTSILFFSSTALSGGEISGGSAQIFKAALQSRNLTTSYERYRVPLTDKKIKPLTQLCLEKERNAVRINKPEYEGELFPVDYEQYQCVEWIAGDSYSGQSKIKFTDNQEAKKYARQFERPYRVCSKKDWVPKSIPLQFFVDFYNKRDGHRLEGRYQYRIPLCGEQTQDEVIENIRPIKSLDTNLI